MSAIIAGIDSLTVRPYNTAFTDATEFSERIARNQQLLLKEESYLDKVADPSGGSYYIENLTESIAGEAWKLFLEIEEKGGYLHVVKEGLIQEMIKETVKTRDHAIATRKEFILGTNQYPNFSEKLELDDYQMFFKTEEQDKEALVETIKLYRGSISFERLRMRTDIYSKTSPRPAAFMFTYGNLAMRIARSQFSRNFFACAGYEVIDNPGFKTVEEGIKSSLDSPARIVVICSSDDEYPEIVPEIAKALKDDKILVVAGYPKEHIEEFKDCGVGYFIHLRSNILEELESFHNILGIPKI
jgi:methylmalonyl-CoA mutase